MATNQASAAVRTRCSRWVSIPSTVTQRAHVTDEVLPNGTGAPDQVATLSNRPIVSKSVRLRVTTAEGETRQWQEIDDLLSAGPEVQVPDPRQPPGRHRPPARPVEVFTVNAESGEIRFGDGLRGKRPPRNAKLRASYDYGVGSAGNVGAGSINSSPALPAGLKVSNPVRTWNGTEAEKTSEGEKQIARYIQHRDRLVNATDFETITLRTPGVDIGRVEVIPAFSPELTPSEPGDAPGIVTLDADSALRPKATGRTQSLIRSSSNTICRYLDPRRLVTTQLILRGPVYKPVWLSVGINVVAGSSIAEVREAVKQSLLDFLAPLRQSQAAQLDNQGAFLQTPQYAYMQKGWPLRKPVTARELLAVASQVSGVLLINDVLICEDTKPAVEQIAMSGLELPRVAGISVTIGDPMDLDQLRGQVVTPPAGTGTTPPPKIVPVPIVPEEC